MYETVWIWVVPLVHTWKIMARMFSETCLSLVTSLHSHVSFNRSVSFVSMAPTVWSRLMTPSRPFMTFQSKVDIIVLIIVLRTGQKVSCFWHMLCWPLAYLCPWKNTTYGLWQFEFPKGCEQQGSERVGKAEDKLQLGLRRVMIWGHWRGAWLVFWSLLLQWTYNSWFGARPPVGMFGERGISMEFIYIYIVYIRCS